MYSHAVLAHVSHPRNAGEVADADGVGEIGDPQCGDVLRVSIRVRGGRLRDVRFKIFGCGAAIASASVLTEMVRGCTTDEAAAVTSGAVVAALGGLPTAKAHCPNLAIDALRLALDDYGVRRRCGGDSTTEECSP